MLRSPNSPGTEYPNNKALTTENSGRAVHGAYCFRPLK